MIATNYCGKYVDNISLIAGINIIIAHRIFLADAALFTARTSRSAASSLDDSSALKGIIDYLRMILLF